MKESFNSLYIYGTGAIAKEVVKKCLQEGKNIVGILDRVRIGGTFEGIKIVEWQDVLPGSAEAVIIAAPNNYCKEIFFRICNYCNARGFKILDASGNSLLSHFGLITQSVNYDYYARSKATILDQLLNYDVISFDIFDTLVMRKVIDPLDVFSYVEALLCDENEIFKGFRKYRRTAEVSCQDGNIYTIYEKLSELMCLEEAQSKVLLETEIQCENELIVARNEIVDILIEAKRLGKKIIAVSDMYFPEEILKSILEKKGIKGIDRFFVSCDNKKSKSNGLFDIVRDNFPDSRILHIGDDYCADVLSPRKSNIDTVGVLKGSDMLVHSPLGIGIGHMYTLADSLWLGEIVVNLFKSPFINEEQEFLLKIDSIEVFVQIYFLPLLELYLENLMKAVQYYEPKKLLFVARDGYVIQKCYEALKEKKLITGPDAHYILCSRRLAVNVGLENAVELEEISKFLGFENVRSFVTEVLGISCNADCGFETIFEHVKTKRNHYVNYLKEKGISTDDKCMLCELDGRGTSAYFLSNIFEKDMPAFFFEKINGSVAYELSSYSIFDIEELNCTYSPFFNYVSVLESLFTSASASVIGIDSNGEFVFAKENRSYDDIMLLEKMQSIAINKIEKRFSLKKKLGGCLLSPKLVMSIFETINEVSLEGQCEKIMEWSLVDDVTGRKLKVKGN